MGTGCTGRWVSDYMSKNALTCLKPLPAIKVIEWTTGLWVYQPMRSCEGQCIKDWTVGMLMYMYISPPRTNCDSICWKWRSSAFCKILNLWSYQTLTSDWKVNSHLVHREERTSLVRGGSTGDVRAIGIASRAEGARDPNLPSQDDMKMKTEKISRKIRELMQLAQEGRHDRWEVFFFLSFVTVNYFTFARKCMSICKNNGSGN